MKNNDDYLDIIDMEHPTSKRHPRMSIENRAAQFSPFAALTGLDDAIEDTASAHISQIKKEEEGDSTFFDLLS